MVDTLIQNRHQILRILAFVLGFTSIVTQVILLREFIVVFYGNETVYAIILASWLFWIAVGSLATSRLTFLWKDYAGALAGFILSVCFVLPLTVLVTRLVKEIMHAAVGEVIGIIPMAVAGFLLTAPLTFILGSMFTLICRLVAFQRTSVESNDQLPRGPSAPPLEGKIVVEPRGETEPSRESMVLAGTVYLWESMGAAVGGVVFSFIFVHVFTAVQIIFFIVLANGAAMMLSELVSKPFLLTASAQYSDRRGLMEKVLKPLLVKPGGNFFKIGVFLIILTTTAYPAGWLDGLDRWIRKVQWKGFEIVHITDSIYGNITLTKMGSEYSLFENGLLSYSTKDELASEARIHYPLLEHPLAQNVLLIGGGLGGGLREALKHPVQGVDYVELDPKVIDVSTKYLPSEFTAVLNDQRVHVIYRDARFFVKRAVKKYDVIIVNLSDPYTAMLNRYYSLEFLREAERILNPQGILALSVSSSENYLNKEARAFLRSVNTTLKDVFTQVKSIPGDLNIFLACKQTGILTQNPDVLISRLQERNIPTKFMREYYLPYQLSEDRIDYIENVLKEPGTLNTDTHPVAYLYDIILWSTHFNLVFKQFMEKIRKMDITHLMTLPLVLLMVGWILKQCQPTSPITISIMTTGLSGIVFQVIVILAFQTLYGFAYYKIGLMMAVFMAGLCLGSLAARKGVVAHPQNVKFIYRLYQLAQLVLCLYPLVLPSLFVIFKEATRAGHLGPLAGVFAVLPIFSGFLGGFQYPVAVHLLNCAENENQMGTRPAVGGTSALSSSGPRHGGGSPRNFSSIWSRQSLPGRQGGIEPPLAGRCGNHEGVRNAGSLYAVDTFGSALGALFTGAILIPLVGIPAVAFFCAAMNAAAFFLLVIPPQPDSPLPRV